MELSSAPRVHQIFFSSLFSCLSSSRVFRVVFSSLSSCLLSLSFSVSLSVSVCCCGCCVVRCCVLCCVVLCCVVLCCVVLCCVVLCCAVWCVVCPFKTLPCVRPERPRENRHLHTGIALCQHHLRPSSKRKNKTQRRRCPPTPRPFKKNIFLLTSVPLYSLSLPKPPKDNSR